ncbi:hypothetical protein R6Q57_019102, partial [Mikania cordata]
MQIEQGDQIQFQETQIASTSVPKIRSPKFVDPEIDIDLEKIKKRPKAIQSISKMSFFDVTNSKSAIFDPNEISGDKCVKSPDHWSLGAIDNSINKHKSNQNYAFTYLIEEAFGIKLKWEVVKDCAQQRNTWECGFCVVKHMYEFFNFYQHDFPKS